MMMRWHWWSGTHFQLVDVRDDRAADDEAEEIGSAAILSKPDDGVSGLHRPGQLRGSQDPWTPWY